MRNVVLFVFLVGLFPGLGHSQTFRAALLGGVNMSQIDGDLLAGFHQIGLSGGAQVLAVLSDRWQVGPGITFSQQGSRRARNEIRTDVDRIRLNFVEVPLMVYFQDWKIQIGAGVSYGRLISYQVEADTGEDISESFTFRPDIFSAVVGATVYVQPRLGLNVQWGSYLNNLETRTDRARLSGRNISVRLVYLLGSQAWQDGDFKPAD